MKLEKLLQALGQQPIESSEEVCQLTRLLCRQLETFELFAQELPSQNLGFVDSKASTVELTIAGRDLTIHQSPGVLSSNRAGGTTGAVVWKVTPLFAEWISSASSLLFQSEILSSNSLVLELGCGISALVGLCLGPRVKGYVLTDQPYVAKFVEQNVAENAHISASSTGKGKAKGKKTKATAASHSKDNNVVFTPLDWETDEATPSLLTDLPDTAGRKSFDAIIACDCIYNEALIDPLVSTCADICRLRTQESDTEADPTICVIAQQLRDDQVFEGWLARFMESFHTWRAPDELLPNGLKPSSGFVVHIGILKEAYTP
ncbi:Ribosomal protein lysine methyltransferase [Podospora bellae-mahoneyi]|uniref:Ribosomal protein lysine methyltransferase n=1 Tax=Podospora bellae-mahoneyi TaxID=2093777 RepID=A0ABR0FMM4_9PEZI|nr:Ribosomal protein lysine methyltransferase [Podospora bellae-mahoneyi]